MAEFYINLGKTVSYENLPTQTAIEGFTFDDVLLVPQISNIEHRRDIDTSVKLGPFNLRVPIIIAPMDTISGEQMIRTIAEEGALASLPRPRPGQKEEYLAIVDRLTQDDVPFLPAIGLKDGIGLARELKERGVQIVLIDIAHGGMETVIDLAKQIKEELGMMVVVGNIATYDQAQAYIQAGIDIARVGVGPGALCDTRQIAGTGYPQLSAIIETVAAVNSENTNMQIIADGGIKKPADAAKALAAGADVVMVGSMFAGTEETPGNLVRGDDGILRKVARGQASESYMTDNGVRVDEDRTPEGISTLVEAKGSAKDILHHLIAGIKSAMSYTGANNLTQFKERAVFKLVSSSTREENVPHIHTNRR